MDLQAAQQLVLDTLQKASSQNPEVLKPAESKLKEWETQPGFYSILYVSTKSIFNKQCAIFLSSSR